MFYVKLNISDAGYFLILDIVEIKEGDYTKKKKIQYDG
jgi:hypothetical protein